MQEPQASNAATPPVGSRHLVTVEDLAFGGDGVARLGDFVVFVPFVIAGEEVEIELTEVKRSFARGRLLGVRTSSPYRVLPECPYYGACGGCQYQHLVYDQQLLWKRKQVAELIHRIGKFDQNVVGPVIGCPKPYGYRNRIMVRSQWDKFKQGLNIGFLRHDNRLVVDITHCPIAEPGINEQLAEVRAHPPPKGGIKVVLRVLPRDWQVPPDSFFQNNYHLLPRLTQTVRAALQHSGVRCLIDAYCGVGFFSLELADVVERYIGVEVDEPAIRSARLNAARRGRINGEFVLARTEEALPHLLEQVNPRQAALLLDPPRTGCDRPMLELLRTTELAQVIYVSCHPATLARDLNVLCANGVFKLRAIMPLDMFPQTQHVECVADVRRE